MYLPLKADINSPQKSVIIYMDDFFCQTEKEMLGRMSELLFSIL